MYCTTVRTTLSHLHVLLHVSLFPNEVGLPLLLIKGVKMSSVINSALTIHVLEHTLRMYSTTDGPEMLARNVNSLKGRLLIAMEGVDIHVGW